MVLVTIIDLKEGGKKDSVQVPDDVAINRVLVRASRNGFDFSEVTINDRVLLESEYEKPINRFFDLKTSLYYDPSDVVKMDIFVK